MFRAALSLSLFVGCAEPDLASLPASVSPPPAARWQQPLTHAPDVGAGAVIAPDGALLAPGMGFAPAGHAAVMRGTFDTQAGMIRWAPFTQEPALDGASLSAGDHDGDGVDDLLLLGTAPNGGAVLRVFDATAGVVLDDVRLQMTLSGSSRLGRMQLDRDPALELLVSGDRSATLLDERGFLIRTLGWAEYMGPNLVDLGGDGRPEVILSGGEVVDGATLSVIDQLPVRNIHAAYEIDADGDGDVDLLVSDLRDRASWTLIDGSTLRTRWTVDAGFTRPIVADADADGQPDLLFANHVSGPPVWGFDPATGARRPDLPTPAPWFRPSQLAAWDHDGDGTEEVVAWYEGSTLWDPRSGWATTPPFFGFDTSFVTGDVNGDGRMEMILGGRSAYSAVPFGMLDAQTGRPLTYWGGKPAPAFSPAPMMLADLDGDGSDELVSIDDDENGVVRTFNGRRPGRVRTVGHVGSGIAKVRTPGGADAVVGFDFQEGVSVLTGPTPWTRDDLHPSQIDSGDVTGDGVDELLMLSGGDITALDQATGAELWTLNRSAGSFAVYRHAAGTDLLLLSSDLEQVAVRPGAPFVTVNRWGLPNGGHGLSVVGDHVFVISLDAGMRWRNLATGDAGVLPYDSRLMGAAPKAAAGGAVVVVLEGLVGLTLP